MTAAQLKAAILDLAIHGKIVPQDPNDEPAKVLLSRLCETRNRINGASRSRPLSRNANADDDNEYPFEVPPGWAWVRVSEIASHVTDGTHKTPKYLTKGVRFVSAKDISNGKLTFDNCKYISQEEHQLLFRRCNPQRGDLLVSKSGSIGATAVVDVDFEFSLFESLALIKFNQGYIVPEYLKYAVRQLCSRLSLQDVKGIGVKHLHLGVLSRQLIPLPPLAEQKRIVAKIDELMPLVERYADAEGRRTKLDENLPAALLKSVLKSAFDGELTPGCDFDERALDDACADVFTGNSLSDEEKKKFTRADGLPFIGTKDVGFDQVIDYENGIRIPASEARYRTAASGATLLCVEGGSSGRKIGLLDRDVRFGNKLCAFVPGTELEAKYLFLYLQSPQFLDQFSELQNGPRKGAGVKQVKVLTIPMTDKGTQEQIVEKVEQLLAQVGRVGNRGDTRRG